MLNRIRRAVSLTRARYFPKGRHRRPLRPSRPTLAPASADESTVDLDQALDRVGHWQPLRGEDTALVRPYVLAHEERTRRPRVVLAPYLPADARSALLGVQ
ncbi:hypothetical protein QFZ43_005965 [Streptomyces afghaniensis]|nr:hypothetical protein [Streptomyces afghaniensis]